MTCVNRVILTGKIAKPAKRLYRPDGSPVIQFLLEVDDPEDAPVLRAGGARQSRRNLIDIVAVGPSAEFDLDRLQAGQALQVQGHLRQRSWRTPEGRNRTHVEVIATEMRVAEETGHELPNERREQ
jgi:single-strand DNA-binding protein